MKENFEIIVGDLPFNPGYNELENAAKVVNANVVDLLKFILNSDIYNEEFIINVENAIQSKFMSCYPFDMDYDVDNSWAYVASQEYINTLKCDNTTLTPEEAAEKSYEEDEPEIAKLTCQDFWYKFLNVIDFAADFEQYKNQFQKKSEEDFDGDISWQELFENAVKGRIQDLEDGLNLDVPVEIELFENLDFINKSKVVYENDVNLKALDIFDCMNENRGCTTFDLCGFLTDLYNLLKKPVDKQSQDC